VAAAMMTTSALAISSGVKAFPHPQNPLFQPYFHTQFPCSLFQTSAAMYVWAIPWTSCHSYHLHSFLHLPLICLCFTAFSFFLHLLPLFSVVVDLKRIDHLLWRGSSHQSFSHLLMHYALDNMLRNVQCSLSDFSGTAMRKTR